jgi:CRISPR-associated protein Csx1
MKECIIYQVLGKLSGYERVSYTLNNSTYNTFLSSIAIYKYYIENKYNASIVYICPYSLIESTKGFSDLKDITNLNLIENKFIESLNKLTDGIKFDILVVNSIGKYKINNKEIDFNSTPGNISLQIFFDIINRIDNIRIDNNNVDIIADISTGHNLYISPLLDALRAVLVRDKLKNGLKTYVNAKYAISEPILRNVKKENYKIFMNEYDVKAFFELPIKKIQNANKIDYYIKTDDKELKKGIVIKTKDISLKISMLLNNLILSFNAIKYNTPLVFYTNLINLEMDEKSIENELMALFSDFLKLKFQDSVLFTYELYSKNIFNLFYSLALYNWIKRKMKFINKATIKEMESIFIDDLYKELGLLLNARFLKRELKSIEIKKDKIQSNWVKLTEIFKDEEYIESNKEIEKYGSDEKRNFFAHSGLLKNIVLVKKEDEEIEFKYDDKSLNYVRKWLLKPEN